MLIRVTARPLFIAALLGSVALMVEGTSARARTTAVIDRFTVIRNGKSFFDDEGLKGASRVRR